MPGSRLLGTTLASTTLTAALLLGSAADGRATRDRPPPGYTGGFGEPSCTQCHIDARANDGVGSLTVAGLPASYDPGATYTIVVTLTQPGLLAGGFELAVRFRDGAQAGSLRTADSTRIDVTTLEGVQYIHHLYDGTEPVAADTARWQFEWTAPAPAAPVIMHVAANASDGDSSPLGDFIYATSAQAAPEK
ncbi:MAG TPA: choice-of-anchor V domain-containing protein [Longimicrobiales bacterium]